MTGFRTEPPRVGTAHGLLADGELLTAADVQQLAVRHGAAAVVLALGPWVLVGDGGAHVPDTAWTWSTTGVRTLRGARSDAGALEGVVDLAWRVFPLRKRPGGAFVATILIGRSQNNDVCLGHSTVSKLHARVRLAGDDAVLLQDACSSNGTKLNGTELPAEVDFRVGHGDVVGFGSLRFQLQETTGLCALLRKR